VRLANPRFGLGRLNLTAAPRGWLCNVNISIKKSTVRHRATADQMRVMADLARTYGHDELRISHEQNVILPHV
jgi:sulfite reductase (NADPH) hemoprotein beta-component